MIEDKRIKECALEYTKLVEWNFLFQIGSCIVIPEDKKEFGVRIKIGEYQYDVDKPLEFG